MGDKSVTLLIQEVLRVSTKVAQELKLNIKPISQSITLAMSSLMAAVMGECTVDLHINDTYYPNTHLSVIENLCGDVILGIYI